MAKTIKFNLICDDKPVRTIEDLQNNFSIEDVLNYFQNGLLSRWLNVRGYETELEKVNAITEKDSMRVVKKLIEIFGVEMDENKIEENVYILKHLEERKELFGIYESQGFKIERIIDDYKTGYDQLVSEIIENPDDTSIIKTNIAEIVNNYSWVFELDHRRLFWEIKEVSPLAIMCFLMNEKSRKYYLPIKTKEKDAATEEDVVVLDITKNPDKKNMYATVCNLITSKVFNEKLGEKFHSFAGVTDGYWKDLEPKGKKYMIISMGSGDFVRSAGVQGGDLAETDITNEFVIVDGIDYKSNSASRKLVYMEV